MGFTEWQTAIGSICLSRGHEAIVENLSRCRWLSMAGDAGPRPGHEKCEPIQALPPGYESEAIT